MTLTVARNIYYVPPVYKLLLLDDEYDIYRIIFFSISERHV